MPIRELTPDKLRRICDPKRLPFPTTDQAPDMEGGLGHQRAIRAIKFGLANKMKGFNIYLLGDPGSGKTSILRKLLQSQAASEPTPPDWVYIYNFEDANRPLALRLPPGMGRQIQKDMNDLVGVLKRTLPKLQEGERYRQEGQRIEEWARAKEARAFAKLKTLGRKYELNIEQVSGELMIQVIRDGRPLEHAEFEQLPARQRKYYEDRVREIQDDISEFMRTQRKIEREKQDRIRRLEREQILKNTSDEMEELKRKYKAIEGFSKWLDGLWQQIPDAFRDYQKAQEESDGHTPDAPPSMPGTQPEFHQFRVNVLVNNKSTKGAPVVYENTPTFHNILGCVEYQEQYGMLTTDFTLIRAGALHKANGGYLVIQINDIMKSFYAWDALKKALRNKEIQIEELDIEQRTRSTVSPRPAPIPLNVKVILIGNYEAYYTLLNYDEDFSRLFKVKAEFDDMQPRTEDNILRYASFIKRLTREDNLLPFSKSAVARIVEEGSRLAEHQNKLTVRTIHIINLVSESNSWAKQMGAKRVEAEHVARALKERAYRTGKIEFEMYEQIREGTVLLDVRGGVVGQINGISVYDLGDHAFGIPSRITAKTYVGRSGILNIDREVRLAGKIHNKASLILAGLIGGLYAQKRPLSMTASICFEQMYGGVEGDSASCAELFALISSLSGVPIKQGVCVTGSLNQMGEVQPIGGVNEKIEGVFRIMKAKGLRGDQGVVIPIQNTLHLMLDDEVIDAVRKGRFHVWAIRNIDEGIEIVTGRPAREVHAAVRKRLEQYDHNLRHDEE